MKLESRSIDFNATLSTPDKWILSRLQHTKIAVEKHLSDYRLDLMSQTLYEFVWHDYCDWYLELSKPLLDNKETRSGCEATLIKVLSETLTLLHPIIPFITEEIFEQCRSLNHDRSERLIIKPYPEIDQALINKKSESEIAWLQEFILGIRKIRGEMNISPGKPLPCFIQNLNTSDEVYIKNNLSIISTLAKLEGIKQLSENDSSPESATALVGEMKILIPLAGLIDKEQEILRLNKEIDKLIKHQQQLSGKLNNKKFISEAPKAVVEKEQLKFSLVEKNARRFRVTIEKNIITMKQNTKKKFHQKNTNKTFLALHARYTNINRHYETI